MTAGVTALLADWVVGLRPDALPLTAIDVSRAAITDCVGVCLAGSTEPMGRIVSGYADELGARPVAGTLAGGQRTSAETSALVGGVLAHALDYDDTWRPSSTVPQATASHPSCAIVPSLVALGQVRPCTGEELIAAYVAGMQAHGKVGFPGRTTVRVGFHGSAVFGALGAAAAAARLLGLDQQQTEMALSLSAVHAGGLNAHRGTMGKPYQVGNVAAGAVRSALLVQRGFTTAVDGLENHHGFANGFLDLEVWDAAAFPQSLAESLSILDPGIDMKRYASCLFTHRALDATTEMVVRHDLRPEHVDSVHVVASPDSIVNRPDPASGLEAKFSLQYTVARAISSRRVGYRDFADAALADDDIRDLMTRVVVTEDPAFTTAYAFVDRPVRIRLRSGAVLEDPVSVGRTAWCRPMTATEVDEKYLDNTETVLGADRSHRSLALLGKLDALSSTEVAELLELVTEPHGHPGPSPAKETS